MSKEKMLYAIMTHKCNLSCPHCTIKDANEKFDHIAFMSELNNFEGKIILFGGEPTANRERMRAIFHSQEHTPHRSPIGSIATNLIILDDELINLYNKIGYVSTSWNHTRFTPDQYHTWLDNITRLGKSGVKPGIIITVTDDLMDSPIEEFLKIVDEWPSEYISWIKFEHLISNDNIPEYFDRADEWLCKLYTMWRSSITVETFDSSLMWYHDCSEVYTLEPDGTIHNVCPNGLYVKGGVPSECLTCDKASECRPCRLQHYCSYPKKLHALICSKNNESEV